MSETTTGPNDRVEEVIQERTEALPPPREPYKPDLTDYRNEVIAEIKAEQSPPPA